MYSLKMAMSLYISPKQEYWNRDVCFIAICKKYCAQRPREAFGSIGYLSNLVNLNCVLAKTIEYFHIFYAMFFLL